MGFSQSLKKGQHTGGHTTCKSHWYNFKSFCSHVNSLKLIYFTRTLFRYHKKFKQLLNRLFLLSTIFFLSPDLHVFKIFALHENEATKFEEFSEFIMVAKIHAFSFWKVILWSMGPRLVKIFWWNAFFKKFSVQFEIETILAKSKWNFFIFKVFLCLLPPLPPRGQCWHLDDLIQTQHCP